MAASEDTADRPGPEALAGELAQVERSAAFRRSPRHRALLHHLVARTLAGATAELKETVIAVEVFGRPAGRFDPALDTIVRVEARRLRERLARHYAGEGRLRPQRIVLPVGSYVPQLVPRPAAGADGGTVSALARDLVERGEHFLRQPLAEGVLRQAAERFDAALRETPGHPPALVGLARAWLNLAAIGAVASAEAAHHAGEALRRALAADPRQPVALALLGSVQHQFEHRWPLARRTFAKAAAMAPQLAFVHTAYGFHAAAAGALRIAERELALARRLDPQYLASRLHMVQLRIAGRRYEEAGRELDALRDLVPDGLQPQAMAGALALYRGDPEGALAAYRRCAQLAPDHPIGLAGEAQALALRGDLAAAQARARALDERFRGRLVSPYLRALVALRCGDVARAFAEIARCLAERDPNAMFLPTDPAFEPLRGDRRWAELLGSVELGSR